MQIAQAVLTLFGIPDTVGHADGRMFATFGGLRISMASGEPIEMGPMKIEARLRDGVWEAVSADRVGVPGVHAVAGSDSLAHAQLAAVAPTAATSAIVPVQSQPQLSVAPPTPLAHPPAVSPGPAPTAQPAAPKAGGGAGGAFASLVRGSSASAPRSTSSSPANPVRQPVAVEQKRPPFDPNNVDTDLKDIAF